MTALTNNQSTLIMIQTASVAYQPPFAGGIREWGRVPCSCFDRPPCVRRKRAQRIANLCSERTSVSYLSQAKYACAASIKSKPMAVSRIISSNKRTSASYSPLTLCDCSKTRVGIPEWGSKGLEATAASHGVGQILLPLWRCSSKQQFGAFSDDTKRLGLFMVAEPHDLLDNVHVVIVAVAGNVPPAFVKGLFPQAHLFLWSEWMGRSTDTRPMITSRGKLCMQAFCNNEMTATRKQKP
jgi:hypothetical protein